MICLAGGAPTLPGRSSRVPEHSQEQGQVTLQVTRNQEVLAHVLVTLFAQPGREAVRPCGAPPRRARHGGLGEATGRPKKIELTYAIDQ